MSVSVSLAWRIHGACQTQADTFIHFSPLSGPHVRVRQLVAATLCVAALTSCGSDDGGPDAEPEPTTSTAPEMSPAWRAALGGISADGTFTRDAALALFAVAFGDMPGVETPTGPPGSIPSATVALRAVLAHEGELTDEQRARVAEVRAVPDGSAGEAIEVAAFVPHAEGAPATPIPSANADLRQQLEAKALQLRQDISARIGSDIPGKLTLVFDPLNEKDPITGSLKAGMADAQFPGGTYTGCNLHLYPATFAEGSDPVVTTAHEMIHCFQAALHPTQAAYDKAPSWSIEGSAEWGAADLVGPDQLDSQLWQAYLTTPSVSLFRQSYEAMGFYAHLAETGHSPWAAYRDLWTATGNPAKFAALGATDAAVLDTWASSMTRKTDFGGAWDTTGPGITSDSSPRTPLVVGKDASVKVKAAAYTNRIYALAANTDLIDVSINGHARIGDGQVDETSLGSQTYCLRSDGCACPDGATAENATQLQGTGALLALTGGPDGATGTVTGRDLDCSGTGGAWHFDAGSRYSGGDSHTVVDAYTCGSLRGPWQGTLHVTHAPATAGDPPLDRIVQFTWSFGRDGQATPTVGPYEDTVFGRTHSVTYYPLVRLDEKARTITIVSMEGSEDGSQRIDVTSALDRIGEPVPIAEGTPPKC